MCERRGQIVLLNISFVKVKRVIAPFAVLSEVFESRTQNTVYQIYFLMGAI